MYSNLAPLKIVLPLVRPVSEAKAKQLLIGGIAAAVLLNVTALHTAAVYWLLYWQYLIQSGRSKATLGARLVPVKTVPHSIS